MCGTAAACASTATWKSTHQSMPDAPAFTSAWSQPTVKPALWSALRGQTVKGHTKTEIVPKPCHSWCINSLWLDGFLGSHIKMPNGRWTKQEDRKFTLFPVFTNDKAFLTVIVLCFQEGWGIHCYPVLQHEAAQNHSSLAKKFAILMLLL